MKRHLKFLVVLLVLVLSLGVGLLAACDDNPGPDDGPDDPGGSTETQYTVTIEGTKTTTQTVKAGESAKKPANDPSKSGYEFDGWYVGNTEYDWSTPVTKNITVTARFTKLGITVRHGVALKNSDGDYYTDSSDTLMTEDAVTFNGGSVTADITPKVAANDCGIIFGVAESASPVYWEENDYFIVIINFNGTVILSKVSSGWNEIANSPALEADYDVETTYSMTVKYKDGFVAVFVDGQKLIYENIGALPGSGAGYRAQKAGTVFSPMVYDGDDYPEIVEAETVNGFTVRNGMFEASGSDVKAVEANSLAVNEDLTMIDGTASVKLTAGAVGDNGLVFSLTDNGKLNFWETGVSYYFFFVNRDGSAYLGKVGGTPAWQQLGSVIAIPNYDVSAEYTLKAEKKGGVIKCYVNDTLYITYDDGAAALIGDKVGIRAGSANTVFGSMTVNAEVVEVVTPEGFKFASGEYEEISGTYRSKSLNALMVSDNIAFTSGTLTAKLTAGAKGDNGIVFGLSDGGESSYFEKDGVSYYFFFININGSAYLAKSANGQWQEIKSVAMSAGYSPATEYTLKVVIDGNVAYCYVNDILYVKSAVVLDGDQVGMRASAANVRFRDFATSQSTEIITADTLLMGHSIIELWTGYQAAFPEYSEIKNIGVGGTQASYWEKMIAEVAAYNPSKIVYMIGGNDLYANLTAAQIIQSIKNTVDGLLAALPDVEICLVNVNQAPSKTEYIALINELNEGIAQYVSENEKLSLADIASSLADDNADLESYFVDDNRHFNVRGYGELSKAVRKALGLTQNTVLGGYETVNGGFIEKDGKAMSVEASSLAVNKDGGFSQGTITATIRTVAGSDNGIVFGLSDNGSRAYWEKGVTYYNFFLTSWGGCYLAKIDNGWNELKSLAIENGVALDRDYELKAEWKDGVIRCYVDGVLYIRYVDANPLTGTKYGFRAIGAGVTYPADITVTDQVSLDVVPEGYNITGGLFEMNADGEIESKAANSLAIDNSRSFAQGTLTVTMQTVAGSDNGIVFGLDDKGETAFWEDKGVTYYNFFLTSWGGCYLAKISDGWHELKSLSIGGVTPGTDYTLKVEYKNGSIKCYVNNTLYIMYHDANALTGTKFGYRAIGVGVTYGEIALSDALDETVMPALQYTAANGMIAEGQNGAAVSHRADTLAVHKTGTFTNGTLTTTVKAAETGDNGVVFGLTAPNLANFWEGEDGLSYYFFFINVGGIGILARVDKTQDGGQWKTLGEKAISGYDVAKTYNVRIERGGALIKCYVDDELLVEYTDASPLLGTAYGVRAQKANVSFGAISITAE